MDTEITSEYTAPELAQLLTLAEMVTGGEEPSRAEGWYRTAEIAAIGNMETGTAGHQLAKRAKLGEVEKRIWRGDCYWRVKP